MKGEIESNADTNFASCPNRVRGIDTNGRDQIELSSDSPKVAVSLLARVQERADECESTRGRRVYVWKEVEKQRRRFVKCEVLFDGRVSLCGVSVPR